MRKHELVYALNAGGVDPEALARIDMEKMRIAGEHPVKNIIPRVIGPATLRPGLETLSVLSAQSRQIEFIRDSSTAALLVMQSALCRIYDQDGVAVPVANAATTVLNPTFSSALSGSATTGWLNDSETGAGTDGVASVAGAVLTLTATKYRSASVQQSVAVAGGDQATAHTFRIDVNRGPVYVRMGTSQDGEQLLTEQRLTTGTHKLTVTPNAAAIWIKIRSEDAETARIVTQVQCEHILAGGATTLSLPTPWAASTLEYLSWDQSADVMFIGDGEVQQRQIERRGAASWSIVLYGTRNGPLKAPGTDKIRLTPNTYTANGTLSSSLPYFKASHVGTLFELTHNEQHVVEELNGANQSTGYVTVTGLFSSTIAFTDRIFGFTIDVTTGSFVGTIALERSTDADTAIWSQVTSYTTDQSINYNDEQSGLTCSYRFRVTSYTSGYANVTMTYLNGSTTGLVRVTAYVNSQSVTYEVISRPGSVTATSEWRGPVWSDDLGWPRVPRLFDGRLWWFRGDLAFASIVDDYDNFDDSTEGDSGPITRSIGSGPAEGARWALDMQRLIAGTSGFEASIRSSSFDEPITPTAFTVRNASTLGVSYVPAVKVDRGAIFVQRSGRRLYELAYSGETNDYTSNDISRLNPGAFMAGIKDIAVQRQPDTRIYIVLEDGTCVVLTYERDDKVVAFTTIETDGDIEDVAVLPAEDQDDVYFIVNRSSTRYLERLAPEYEQRSVSTCTLLDQFKVLTGSVSSITGGTHLANQTVQVWADGAKRDDVVLNGSGVGSLGATYSRVVYGKRYTGVFKSVKLSHAAGLGTALGQTKIVHGAGLILSNSCLDGIQVGRDASNLDPMPDIINGAERTASQFFTQYDHDVFPINSDWDADARLYLTIDSAGGPVTVQGLVLDVETRDGSGNAAPSN